MKTTFTRARALRRSSALSRAQMATRRASCRAKPIYAARRCASCGATRPKARARAAKWFNPRYTPPFMILVAHDRVDDAADDAARAPASPSPWSPSPEHRRAATAAADDDALPTAAALPSAAPPPPPLFRDMDGSLERFKDALCTALRGRLAIERRVRILATLSPMTLPVTVVHNANFGHQSHGNPAPFFF